MASPWVETEWTSFLGRNPEARRARLLVVELVATSLPPFLADIRRIDFRDHDEAKYRAALAEIVGALLGRRDRRRPPQLAPGITIPERPRPEIPATLRAELLRWMAPKLARRKDRLAAAAALGLAKNALDDYPSPEGAASAALVLYTGADNAAAAAVRAVDTLAQLDEEETPPLRARLQELRGGRPGLLGIYLRHVAAEHDRLVPYFQQKAELEMLERVYVRLDLRSGLGKEGELTARLPDCPLGIREVLALAPSELPGVVTRRWVVRSSTNSAARCRAMRR